MTKYMKAIKFIFGIILGIALLNSCSGYNFKYNVEVQYQYENDSTVNYILSFEDNYSYNSMVKDIEVSYFVPAGYVNKLTIVSTVKFYPDGTTNTYKPRELMFVPDRKFKVVDIKVTGGKVE